MNAWTEFIDGIIAVVVGVKDETQEAYALAGPKK